MTTKSDRVQVALGASQVRRRLRGHGFGVKQVDTATLTGESPLTRRNRVTPFGQIIATPERGTFMGNRGVLHDAEGRIRRLWQVKRWIVCVLEFRGRKRMVMSPNSYTELFFLDEATAFAAGHRPCAECRHDRFVAFCTAWKLAKPGTAGSQRPTAKEIDNRLHAERLAADDSKRSYVGLLDDLPDGVFVTDEAWGERPWLVWGEYLLEWSLRGYRQRQPRPKGRGVSILTPPSSVAAIQAGYAPEVHASARLPTIDDRTMQ